MTFKFSLHKPRTSQAGFTLIEVIASIGIFSIAILGVAVSTITVTRANKYSQFHTVATNLAQDKLEQLKAMNATSFSGVMTACPSYTSSGCSDAAVSSNATFTRSWKITSGTGINSIDVKIDWTDYSLHSLTVSSSVSQ